MARAKTSSAGEGLMDSLRNSPATKQLTEEAKHLFSAGSSRITQKLGDGVTGAAKKLTDIGLVEHTPYKGVHLTEKGEVLSVALLRKHRLVERMLVDFLELPWDDVHELACKLEHYISEDVADRIAKALNYPKTCPHGNPVDATVNDGSHRLEERSVGDELTVAKITDERLEFLSYVMDIGLIPGAHVQVKSRTPFGDVMTLRVEGKDDPIAIGRDVANSIWVFDSAPKAEGDER